jgi:succinate-semialdehyde dehydrogenase/glutarate-semialdehyde dehydrogenase
MVIEQSATTIKTYNPATKELLGEVAQASAKEVEQAVAASWQAFESWQATSFKERSKALLKLRKVISQNADEIAKLISNEVGKPICESYMAEMVGPLDACVWFAENTEKALEDQSIAMTNPLLLSKQSIISFEPLGVVGIISPWNYPFAIPMMSIIMAIACGNTVVLKPSEKCPLIGIKIGELFKQAGFPDNVVTIITGGRSTGALLSQSKVAKLIFTGSAIGGSKVMAQAAENLTPVSLELGGKDAAIVLPDAPVAWTARGLVWGAFTNCGQACASIERVYMVKGPNNQKLIDEIVSQTKKLELGPGINPNSDVGPMIDDEQLAKVESHVEQAKASGANVLCGGKKRDDLGGYFYEPTVLTNVNHSMDVMLQETFGPVMPIVIVESEDEAIDLANESHYGLSASIWTRNLSKAEDIARDLEAGTIFINDGLFSFASPQVPWGGSKKSGGGRTHSYFGLLDLVNIKHITIDSAGGMNRLWWYPYGKSRTKLARAGVSFLHGNNPVDTVQGLINFATNFLQKPKS